MTVARRLRALFLAATGVGSARSFSVDAITPLKPASLARRGSAASVAAGCALSAKPRHPRDTNWEDDTKSSRTDPFVTDYLPPWRNHEGQQAFTNFSGSQANPGGGNRPFKAFSGASNLENVSIAPGALPSQQQQSPRQAAPAIAVPRGGSSTNTLLHNIRWPLIRDPPGVTSEFPLLATRIGVTVLSAVAAWYLHLFRGYSPVLASSAMTLLVSTCLDRRLGQAAFCGSFAGMSGGHLAPNISIALLLGALTSASYEVLIHFKNFALGVGGRLGATAFLATSILAKYQGVAAVGRKMRRGLWRAGSGPSEIVVSMVLYHVLGSVATIFLRECSDDSAAADPVRASSVVGLLGSLFIADPTAVLALYGGSFVGMSLPSRLMYGNAPGHPKAAQPQTPFRLFATFGGAGAIAGLVHATTLHYGYWTGGWGGKAGMCAFAGCWVYRVCGNTYDFLRKKSK